ncbi:Integrase core domain-containing protein [Rhizobium tibeticum]|uniref:Integrase core domain protein n=3 Tax=Rhizobium tibeticum TaxID=501024 RepID=A0A1H8WTN7_9HYPH|nr:Integrase core domain protein [Rhizobium tibeticum]SEP30991.1 Integrase core domain-containing protein [Rhizobium tibeticum]
MATRTELVEAIIERYRSSCRADKQRILDEFVAVTGYHRKHAIRVLARRKKPSPGHKNTSLRYGSDVRDALIVLWEVSERLCSKRLKPLIPVLLPALERHGRLELDATLRGKLMTVSPATMDRLLTEVRIAARGGQRRRAGMSSAVRRSVPVRTFGDWNDPPPGFVEVDFVAHSGTSSSGSFVQTMVLTDISTGWTECVPVRTRDSGKVIVAIKQARSQFPFPLLGVDFDNDSAFMNEFVVSWCRSENLEVTRSRAYRKNDQAHVEQKNGAIVRRLVGYGRFVGTEATIALSQLYAVVRLYGNLFQPSFKLQDKTRIGARVIKRYHPPVPPAARVLANSSVAKADKKQLQAMLENSDPVLLFASLRAAQEELGRRVDRRGVNQKLEEPVVVDLQRFAASLKLAWKNGETRPTHRRPYRRTKPWPKRPSMYEPFEAQIKEWLKDEPALSAAGVLQRLTEIDPARFKAKNIRMVQRLVKAWRMEMAGLLILDGGWIKSLPASPAVAAAGDAGIPKPATFGNIYR